MSGAAAVAVRVRRDGRLRTWLAAEQGRLAPWIAVLMGAGVLLYFALRQEPPPWVGFAAVAAGVAACAAGWRSLEGRVLGLAVLATAAGFLAAQAATWRALPVEALPRRAVVVTAQVEAVEALPEGERRVVLGEVQVAPDAAPLARTFRLRLDPDDSAPLAVGARVRVRLLLRPPMPPAYPGAWDVQRDAFFAGQGGSARALGDVVVLDPAPARGVARWWQGVRERVGNRVRAALPGAVGAVAATLLTGEQAAIPAADRAAFRDSGLAHLLAVAGLHIGIVMGLAFGVTRRALALSERAALHWPCKALAAGAALAVGGAILLKYDADQRSDGNAVLYSI
ncbi:MAG: ComEC family DNA internalization-related competence protein, partial [Acetobacteraceae bacterium]|nr:ComEC family DNA internalization-related competence protein [Acetobacteraceae bacterium]